FERGNLGRRSGLELGLEGPAFGHRVPYPPPYPDEQRRGEERNPPAPRAEIGVGLQRGHEREHARGEDETRGNAGLRPTRPEAPPPRVAMLGGEEHGAAPFAAHREALDEAEEDQGE